MAYATPRSCNAELNQGSIDGTYKQCVKNRGGSVEHFTSQARMDLDRKYYAVNEASSFVTPDNQRFMSMYATHVPVCPMCGEHH